MKFIFVTSFLILILDQLTKYLLKNKTIIVTNFFKIDYTENIGAAFGILKGFNWLFIIVTFAVIFLMFRHYKEIRKEGFYVRLAVGFLLGGVLGNLIDRLFLGYVRDFLAFSFWPTFNVADTFSTVGIFILALHMLIKK